MKITLIFFFTLVSLSVSYAQVRDDLYDNLSEQNKNDVPKSIPKGVSKILVHTNNNRAENFQLIGDKLVENNFQIDKANKDFWIISTVSKSHNKPSFSYILNFVAKDSIILITGTININLTVTIYNVESQSNFEKIQNKGMKGSPIKEAFFEMYTFAKNLTDKKELDFLIE